MQVIDRSRGAPCFALLALLRPYSVYSRWRPVSALAQSRASTYGISALMWPFAARASACD